MSNTRNSVIQSITYFSGQDGILGEAAAQCSGDTLISEVITGAPTKLMQGLQFCVLTLTDKEQIVGVFHGRIPRANARALALEDALSELDGYLAEKNELPVKT